MKQRDLSKMRKVLERISIQAGSLVMGYFRSKSLVIQEKGDHSPVTEADFQAQDLILRKLKYAYPAIPIVSEEMDAKENAMSMKDTFFIVDPLDSTKNFVTGIPFFDISIALIHDGIPIVGVVRDPVHRITYSAIRGRGSWENGRRIRTRSCTGLSKADLDVNVTRVSKQKYKNITLKIVPTVKKVRYFGSAVLEGCWVARGSLDGIINHSLAAWDLAAVTLIIEEAGGIWGDLDGIPYRLDSMTKRPFMAFGDRRLMRKMVGLIRHG